MATTVIRKLRDDLARIEAERARLEEEAEHFRRVIAFYEQHADDAEDSAVQTPGKALANELWQILESEGGGLHYRELYERLRQRGVNVPGKDPRRNVGAHLSADPRFENVSRGVWGLRSWKNAPPQEHPVVSVTPSSDYPDDPHSTITADDPVQPDDTDQIDDDPFADLVADHPRWRSAV